MTSSRGGNPTRWVRRKASDRELSSPPQKWLLPKYIGLSGAPLQTQAASLLCQPRFATMD